MTGRQTSLRALLRRAHLGFALGAVALVGAALVGPGLVTLHVYAEHDLRLMARAVAYSLEAAVVFDDADATAAGLRIIVQSEDVLAARVTSRTGAELARRDAPGGGLHRGLERAVARLLHDGPARVPILHDGEVVGRVELQGGARTLLQLLGYGALAIVVCQAAVAAGALALSGRIQRRILRPVAELADVAATVQRDRAFSRRVPRTEIRELDGLGATFNLLLAELETWHAGITGENRRLSHEATHDKLTGLSNRAHFEAGLELALAVAAPGGPGGAPRVGTVAVMLLDCNGFKQVNDTYGHAAGDAVLVTVAGRLRMRMRANDLVARIGGDEFAVLLAPAPPAAVLDALARMLEDDMRAPVPVLDGQAATVGLSVGIARYPDDAANIQDLLRHADLAMYRDKQARRAHQTEF